MALDTRHRSWDSPIRDIEELPNEEIAGIVGETVATVKSRLHRARMALRELLTRSLAPARDN